MVETNTIVNSNPTAIVNSMTHPAAWAFLNRLVKAGEVGKEQVSQEVIDEWKAGGTARSKLLTSFVDKVYVQGAEHRTNTLRLEAWVKIRQACRDWRTSLKGYEWLSEHELGQAPHSWPEQLGFNFSGCDTLFFWAGTNFRPLNCKLVTSEV